MAFSRNSGATCQIGCPATFGNPRGSSSPPFHRSPSTRLGPPSYRPEITEYTPLSNRTLMFDHFAAVSSIADGMNLPLSGLMLPQMPPPPQPPTSVNDKIAT